MIKLPTRNEETMEVLAEKMYGETTPIEVEVASLKVLVNAIAMILLEKGIFSRKELSTASENAFNMFQVLKNLQEKNEHNETGN